jgi:hypothetical protein
MQSPGYQNRAIAFPDHENSPTQGHQITPVPKDQNTQLVRSQTSLVPRYRNARMLEYHSAPIICPNCRNMDAQNVPLGRHQSQVLGQIEVYLPHFLATSKLGCPFCRVLLNIFQRFVPTAEAHISRASRDPWNVQATPSDMSMKLVLEPDQPVGIMIRDGMYPNASIHAHLLCYNPSGTLAVHPLEARIYLYTMPSRR